MDSFTSMGEKPPSSDLNELKREQVKPYSGIDIESVEFSNLKDLDLSFEVELRDVEIEEEDRVYITVKIVDDEQEVGVIRGKIRNSKEFYIDNAKVDDEIRAEGLGTDLFKRLIAEIKQNDKFSDIEKISGYIRHRAQLKIREKFFGTENLVFKDSSSGETLEAEEVEVISEKNQSDRDLINGYIVEADLDDLQDNWQEIE